MVGQEWDCSLDLPGLDELESFGYDETESSSVLSFLRSLRELANDMRRGKLITDIDLTQHAVVFEEELLPYWGQFVDALAEYNFVLDYRKADGFNLKIDDIGLPSSFLDMLGDALQQTHCNSLEFSSIDAVWEHVWSGCNFVIKCIQSNPTLQTLDWDSNSFREYSDNMDILYTTINNYPSLHHLSFCDCSRAYRTALSDIFRKLTSKSLRTLFLAGNHLSNLRPTDMSRFLAANPRLKRLDLSRNPLGRQDIIYISDALKHNTNLRRLDIKNMDVELGNLSFVIFDDSSMNAAYTTNHYCKIETTDSSDSYMFNRYNDPKLNMRKKIYYVLSKRHQSRENASCFDSEGIDIKHLPNILAILKPYSDHHLEADIFTRKQESIEVVPLSIVYEIMRGWRMPELYNFVDKMDTSA